MNNMPSIIFDWIELYAFSELNNNEKQLVLQYISEDEYNELFEASSWGQQNFSAAKTAIKDHSPLLKQYLKPSERPTKVWPWQAAAAILLLLSTFLFFRKTQSITGGMVDKIATLPEPSKPIHDTVFVDRILEREVVKYIPALTKQVDAQKSENPSHNFKQQKANVATIAKESNIYKQTFKEIETKPIINENSLTNSYAVVESDHQINILSVADLLQDHLINGAEDSISSKIGFQSVVGEQIGQ